MSSNRTSSNRLLVVFGIGPGVGNAVTSLLTTKRYFKVALLARSERNLQQSKESLEAAARRHNRTVDIKTWAVDLATVNSLVAILPEIEQFGELECVFYNGARFRAAPFFQETEGEIRYDFEITNVALYAIARWAIPKLQALATHADAIPSFLVTNSLLYKYPEAPLFTLSLTKAAQRILVQTLAQTYQKDGVHVGLISIGGSVRNEDPTLNPKNIAEKTWEFFSQRKEEWAVEVEILPEQLIIR